MHKYDYSFLEKFPLPENVSSLLECLRGMQKRLGGKAGAGNPAQKPDLSEFPEKIITAYKRSDAEPLLLVPCVTLDMLDRKSVV